MPTVPGYTVQLPPTQLVEPELSASTGMDYVPVDHSESPLGSSKHKRMISTTQMTTEQRKARKKLVNDARLKISDFKGNRVFYQMLKIIRSKIICSIATNQPFPDSNKLPGVGKQEIA